jgi:5-methyltetrahydropteroyltriglutamate--homocysteine methyltransferase
MKHSKDRILTTHVGSLPRSAEVTEVLFARDKGEKLGHEADKTITDAVAWVVEKQKQVGIDVINDGEMNKISYATYIKDRLTGFAGDTPREPGQDLLDFPSLLKKLADGGKTAQYQRPRCQGEIAVKDMKPLQIDVANLTAAADRAGVDETFMNAASPGVIALFQPNDYYPGYDAYLEALAEGMRAEYEGIVNAGIILQIDAPDFGMGRHTMYKDKSAGDYLKLVEKHVEVTNHALRNIPKDRVRLHMCWGNYEGPHHHDVPLADLLPVAAKLNVGALLIEGANPRHSHEWKVFKDVKIPDDLIIIPGVLSTTSNYIEHPEVVADRICNYANVIGRERVIAGTDCGFGTFAGFGPVEPEISYMKLASMVEGAKIASDRLW